jgi:hypothetical protein
MSNTASERASFSKACDTSLHGNFDPADVAVGRRLGPFALVVEALPEIGREAASAVSAALVLDLPPGRGAIPIRIAARGTAARCLLGLLRLGDLLFGDGRARRRDLGIARLG